MMIGEQELGIEHTVELPEAPDEVRLPVREVASTIGVRSRRIAHPMCFIAMHALGLDQLGVEPVERQLRRQYRVLDVETAGNRGS